MQSCYTESELTEDYEEITAQRSGPSSFPSGIDPKIVLHPPKVSGVVQGPDCLEQHVSILGANLCPHHLSEVDHPQWCQFVVSSMVRQMEYPPQPHDKK